MCKLNTWPVRGLSGRCYMDFIRGGHAHPQSQRELERESQSIVNTNYKLTSALSNFVFIIREPVNGRNIWSFNKTLPWWWRWVSLSLSGHVTRPWISCTLSQDLSCCDVTSIPALHPHQISSNKLINISFSQRSYREFLDNVEQMYRQSKSRYISDFLIEVGKQDWEHC